MLRYTVHRLQSLILSLIAASIVIFATVEGADTVKMVEVKTGIQDDTYIEVTSGLDGTEEIVVGPYSAISKKLESGKAITKKEDKDKKELAAVE